jgi:hypothetical protein
LEFSHSDLLPLLSSKLAEVAVLAQAKGMVGLIPVLTVVGELGSTVAVVAWLTETFCIERFVDVRASVDLFGFSLFFLAGFFPIVCLNGHIASPCLIAFLLFFICVIIVADVRNGERAHRLLLKVDVLRPVRLPDELTQDTTWVLLLKLGHAH